MSQYAGVSASSIVRKLISEDLIQVGQVIEASNSWSNPKFAKCDGSPIAKASVSEKLNLNAAADIVYRKSILPNFPPALSTTNAAYSKNNFAYANGKLFAYRRNMTYTDTNKYLWVSSDEGITWTRTVLPLGGYTSPIGSGFTLSNIIYAFGQFYAFATRSGRYFTSPDGITWSIQSFPAACSEVMAFTSVVVDDSGYINIFGISPGASLYFFRSTDGLALNWTRYTIFTCSANGFGFSNVISFKENFFAAPNVFDDVMTGYDEKDRTCDFDTGTKLVDCNDYFYMSTGGLYWEKVAIPETHVSEARFAAIDDSRIAVFAGKNTYIFNFVTKKYETRCITQGIHASRFSLYRYESTRSRLNHWDRKVPVFISKTGSGFNAVSVSAELYLLDPVSGKPSFTAAPELCIDSHYATFVLPNKILLCSTGSDQFTGEVEVVRITPSETMYALPRVLGTSELNPSVNFTDSGRAVYSTSAHFIKIKD